MGLIEMLEKLITEHGSATVLRQQLALTRDQAVVQAQKYAELEAKKAEYERQAAAVNAEKTDLKEQLRRLEKTLSEIQSGNPAGYVCDHCGSPRLKRTGSRPDATFGRLGVKQALFRCEACNEMSAFTP